MNQVPYTLSPEKWNDIGYAGCALGVLDVAPVRIGATSPVTVRMVHYPDGTEKLQGGFPWTQGFNGGLEWRDLPIINVDANGRELE